MDGREITNQEEPKIIYHYTTLEALLNILKTSELWATKIHYMNDASELEKPLRTAENQINVIEKELNVNKPKQRGLHEEISKNLKDDICTWRKTNIFVASFCKKGDLLGQWRAYGLPGSVCAIGFNRKQFMKSIKTYPFELVSCKYFDNDSYIQEIYQFILEFFERSIKNKGTEYDFIFKLIEKAVTMKLDFFKDEEECRIISTEQMSYADEKTHYRTGKSIIIPYYKIPFKLDCIEEIIIGPGPHQELTKLAITGLIYKYKLRLEQHMVKLSQIPYRSL